MEILLEHIVQLLIDIEQYNQYNKDKNYSKGEFIIYY